MTEKPITLDELNQMRLADVEAMGEAEQIAFAMRLYAGLPGIYEEAERIAREPELVARAQAGFTLDAFEAYFELLTGYKLPEHHKKAMGKVFEAYEAEEGVIIEMFRGAAKTTVENGAFGSFLVGSFPEETGVLVQVGDAIANDNGKMIADYVEYNPGFKKVFPHVVPDKEKGWGANGYFVKRDDMEYGEWRKRKASSKDPSFVAVGYKSSEIIGKRPYWLIIDDINDENNSSSDKELENMVKIMQGTIFPAANLAKIIVVIGTPWNERDAIAVCKGTGIFRHVKIPVYEEMGGGEKKYAWPEVYDEKRVERERAKAGSIEFARMFLLDLKAAQGMHLKREWLHKYPYDKVDVTWPVVMGVDYASTRSDARRADEHDNCAIAVGRAIPGGMGVVLVDGFYGKVSQGEAELKLRGLAEVYKPQIIGMEAVGKGEEFYYLMLRTSNLPIMPVSPGRKDKGVRFEKGMAPLFEFNRAWVSDVETPFIKSFVDEWLRWPTGEHDDALDAVYWMLYVGVPHMMGKEVDRVQNELAMRTRVKTDQTFMNALAGR